MRLRGQERRVILMEEKQKCTFKWQKEKRWMKLLQRLQGAKRCMGFFEESQVRNGVLGKEEEDRGGEEGSGKCQQSVLGRGTNGGFLTERQREMVICASSTGKLYGTSPVLVAFSRANSRRANIMWAPPKRLIFRNAFWMVYFYLFFRHVF